MKSFNSFITTQYFKMNLNFVLISMSISLDTYSLGKQFLHTSFLLRKTL